MSEQQIGIWFMLALLAILLAQDLLRWHKEQTVGAILLAGGLAILALWVLRP